MVALGMRKFLFWPHLIAGVLVGLVILVMSITGVLLTYEKQVVAWADSPANRVAIPDGSARLSIDQLLAASPAKPTALTVSSDPTAAAQLTLPQNRVVFVDPYTGRITGEGCVPTRNFFRQVTAWHRWLGQNTPLSKGITGASNLAFLFLLLTGVPMWIQRPIVWFRRRLSPKARDYNWHHVLGIWASVPLLLIVFTAVFFSYSWATPLLYRVTGEALPAPEPPVAVGPGPYQPLFLKIQSPSWRSIALRPASGSFTVEEGSWGRVDLKTQWVFDPASGALLRTERFADLPLARRLRTWVRTVHTGEAAGWLGQTVAGLASAAAVVLVWTGLALSWRRLRAARS
jgi:uncharacterized iron-regulated membrane protein